VRLEQRAAIANLSLEVTAGDEALNRNGAVGSQGARDCSSVEIEGSLRRKLQANAPGSSADMPIGFGLAFYANFAAGGCDPILLTPRSVTSPEAASIRALPAVTCSISMRPLPVLAMIAPPTYVAWISPLPVFAFRLATESIFKSSVPERRRISASICSTVIVPEPVAAAQLS